ncbi:MAG: UDP-2,3-diacylglucosamine diphosphatase LpxI, partial [Planctomycetales bacterium]|nr:UDP-2,3-diacylglucosamine diphosphatase LpxI [Planctomycetales bacterium]
SDKVDAQAPVGLIAGWGSFPVEVAERVIASGRRVCCVAITDHASPELESLCDHVKWSGVGKIGAHIRYFRRRGVREVTMAGKLFKSDLLFQGSVWIKHCPDLTAIRTFGPCLLGSRPDSRDDSLLLAVTNTYANHSLTICPATDFAPELLVDHGHLIGKPLTAKQSRDADFGWQVAKQMGGMDIGQSITIKDGTVLAVEAVEGTDQCIERTGQLCRRGGWTLVKVSKPNQDMRFDVPTIGPQTVQRVAENGGTAIVIEADKTILVERQQTFELAKKHGITIVALADPQSIAAVA